MAPVAAPAATLPAALRRAAVEHGARPAVVDGTVRLSYGELLREVQRAAAVYVSAGVRPGERVAIWAPNSWQWEVAALAATYVGGVLVPLNTRYTGHEVVDIITRARVRLLVMVDRLLGRDLRRELDGAAIEAGVTLPEILLVVDGPAVWSPGIAPVDPEQVESRADAVSPDDIADVLYTSGTTGRSKGVMSTHRQTLEVARSWGLMGEVGVEDRYLVVNPFFHSFGYKAGLVTCLLAGASVHPMAVFDTTELLRRVQDERITVLPGAPTIYTSLLEAPDRSRFELSSLRLAVTGAAIVPDVLVERMQRELTFDLVLTAYGLTECVVATMCRRGDTPAVVARSCGRVVPGLEMRIVDPSSGEVAAADTEGEVQFRGTAVMLGYLDEPDATAQAIDPDGWLHTGDIGRMDADGYLTITDRLKDMFITGGFNVYPAEVEQVLARLEGVLESAVVGVPDARLGEVGKAYVVRRPGSDLAEADVLAFARERLANFKVPRSVSFIDVIPRNVSGKALKRELRP